MSLKHALHSRQRHVAPFISFQPCVYVRLLTEQSANKLIEFLLLFWLLLAAFLWTQPETPHISRCRMGKIGLNFNCFSLNINLSGSVPVQRPVVLCSRKPLQCFDLKALPSRLHRSYGANFVSRWRRWQKDTRFGCMYSKQEEKLGHVYGLLIVTKLVFGRAIVVTDQIWGIVVNERAASLPSVAFSYISLLPWWIDICLSITPKISHHHKHCSDHTQKLGRREAGVVDELGTIPWAQRLTRNKVRDLCWGAGYFPRFRRTIAHYTVIYQDTSLT